MSTHHRACRRSKAETPTHMQLILKLVLLPHVTGKPRGLGNFIFQAGWIKSSHSMSWVAWPQSFILKMKKKSRETRRPSKTQDKFSGANMWPRPPASREPGMLSPLMARKSLHVPMASHGTTLRRGELSPKAGKRHSLVSAPWPGPSSSCSLTPLTETPHYKNTNCMFKPILHSMVGHFRSKKSI